MTNKLESSFTRYTIIVPENNRYGDPEAMRCIAEALKRLNIQAEFETESGIPVRDEAGTYTLTTRDPLSEYEAMGLLLRDCGLIAVPDKLVPYYE